MGKQHNFQGKNHSKKWDVHTYIVLLYLDSSHLKNLSHILKSAKGIN